MEALTGLGPGHDQCCEACGGKVKGKEWIPATKLGCVAKDMKMKDFPVKESQIIDLLLGPSVKDEFLKVIPVQKQIQAGQWARFKLLTLLGITKVITALVLGAPRKGHHLGQAFHLPVF